MVSVLLCLVLICLYVNLSGTAGICPDKPMTFSDAVMFCQTNSGTLGYGPEEINTCFPDAQNAWYGTYSELTSWFSLQGCYRINRMVDTIESVTMKARDTSLIDCYNSCKQQDHIYDHFYVQRNVCLCSNSLHEHDRVDDRLCSNRCGGDVTQFCGGDQDVFTVYKEEHLKYSNNNKDQLCTYQSCVPSLDIGSESCNTSYRSICGDFVSLKINTWAGSVIDCFTTRGLYLKSEVDCRIQNKERLWLGIFREHVTYFASGRPPLPGKPLTGCGLVTNSSTIIYENCRQEKVFVCKRIQALNVRVYTGSSKTDYSASTPQYSHADTQEETTAGPAIDHMEKPSLNTVCYLVVIAMGCFIIIQSFFCFFIAVKRFVPKSNQEKQLPPVQDRDF